MENWVFFSILLPIVCSMAVTVCLFLLLNWSVLRVYLGMEYRLSDLEGKVIRETKIRASDMSRSSKNLDRELLERISQENQKPKMTLENWRQSKFNTNQGN